MEVLISKPLWISESTCSNKRSSSSQKSVLCLQRRNPDTRYASREVDASTTTGARTALHRLTYGPTRLHRGSTCNSSSSFLRRRRETAHPGQLHGENRNLSPPSPPGGRSHGPCWQYAEPIWQEVTRHSGLLSPSLRTRCHDSTRFV